MGRKTPKTVLTGEKSYACTGLHRFSANRRCPMPRWRTSRGSATMRQLQSILNFAFYLFNWSFSSSFRSFPQLQARRSLGEGGSTFQTPTPKTIPQIFALSNIPQKYPIIFCEFRGDPPIIQQALGRAQGRRAISGLYSRFGTLECNMRSRRRRLRHKRRHFHSELQQQKRSRQAQRAYPWQCQ